MTGEQCQLLNKWCKEVQSIYRAHYGTAIRLRHKNYWLGIPAIVLAAVVGTSVFAALESKPQLALQIAVGLMSIAVAVLSALQTLLRFSERAESHRAIAAKFATLHRKACQYLANPPQSDSDTDAWATAFRTEWDKLSDGAPTSNSRDWAAARRRTDEEWSKAITPNTTPPTAAALPPQLPSTPSGKSGK